MKHTAVYLMYLVAKFRWMLMDSNGYLLPEDVTDVSAISCSLGHQKLVNHSLLNCSGTQNPEIAHVANFRSPLFRREGTIFDYFK
jgi:hypothetical protein